MSATLLKQPLCTVVRQGKQSKVSGLNLLRLKAHLHRQHLSPSLIKLHSELKLDELQTDNTPDYVRLVLRSSVYDVINESPISQGVGLSSRLNTNVILKREDLLPVFFKLRGAYNMIAKLDDSQRNQGVIACSAGNHAQGVAFAAKHLKIPATIVMPVCTPSIKYQNVSRLGLKSSYMVTILTRLRLNVPNWLKSVA